MVLIDLLVAIEYLSSQQNDESFYDAISIQKVKKYLVQSHNLSIPYYKTAITIQYVYSFYVSPEVEISFATMCKKS